MILRVCLSKNQKRAVEVQQDRAKIQQAEQAMSQEMQKKYQEKTVPILKKAEDAIKAVAAEKGIVYVLDAAFFLKNIIAV